MSLRRHAPYLLAAWLLGCTNNTDAPPASFGPLLVPLGEQVILPEHRQFVTDADDLVGALQALERSPDADALTRAQVAWRAARKAYRMLDAVLLVPDVNLRITERIDVAPADGAGIEKLVSGTAAVDDTAVSNAGGRKKGFLGLEYLLFPAPGDSNPAPVLLDDAARARRLKLAVSMADEIAASARELDGVWELDQQGFIAEFEHPSLSAQRYQSELDVVNDLVGAGNYALETIVGIRLALPLGRKTGGHPDALLDPTSRSDNAVEDMQSSLAGFVAVYTTAAFTGAVQERSAALDAQVHSEISSSQVTLAAIPAPFASAVMEQTAVVQAAYDATQALKHTWNADVTSALGATFRVGDNDGD
ncbi:MAG: imelysin family protein [Pseudomonadota bacterium]